MYNGQQYDSSNPLNISLQFMEAMLVYASRSDCELTGARISSSRRVSAFSGNFRTAIAAPGTTGWYNNISLCHHLYPKLIMFLSAATRDHLVEQLFPTQAWGSNFIIAPTATRTVGDYLQIVAFKADTQLSVQQSAWTNFTLQAGESRKLLLQSASITAVYSTQPIEV